MNSPKLLAASASGDPIFIVSNDISESFPVMLEYLKKGSCGGRVFKSMKVLVVADRSFHSVRLSNRPDARERPFLTSHSFLVGGPGECRESGTFEFDGFSLVFKSGMGEIGCEVVRSGLCQGYLDPTSAMDALCLLLTGARGGVGAMSLLRIRALIPELFQGVDELDSELMNIFS